MMVSNHRIVGDGSDWMRDVERRVGRQERRPAPVDVKAVFGTAINQRARQIADWNDPEALRNGWYYTESFGIHSPDPDYMWMGECIVTYEGHGTQMLWSHGAPSLYQYVRTFHWHENEAPDFAPWEQVYPTPIPAAVYQNCTAINGTGLAPYGTPTSTTVRNGWVQLLIECQSPGGLGASSQIFQLPAGAAPGRRVWVNCGSPFAPHRNYQIEINTAGYATTLHALPGGEVLLGHATFPTAP